MMRVDLGLTAAGIAFIASLVISAMLMMAETPNAEHLSKGSGINRSSVKPDRKGEGTQATPPTLDDDAEEEPRYGKRLPKQDV